MFEIFIVVIGQLFQQKMIVSVSVIGGRFSGGKLFFNSFTYTIFTTKLGCKYKNKKEMVRGNI